MHFSTLTTGTPALAIRTPETGSLQGRVIAVLLAICGVVADDCSIDWRVNSTCDVARIHELSARPFLTGGRGSRAPGIPCRRRRASRPSCLERHAHVWSLVGAQFWISPLCPQDRRCVVGRSLMEQHSLEDVDGRPRSGALLVQLGVDLRGDRLLQALS